MANFDALDLISKPRSLGNFGNAGILLGEVTPASNPAADDQIRILKIPAGFLVTGLTLDHLEVDTNVSPTLDVDIGYYPVNTDDGPLVADDNYFMDQYLGLGAIARKNDFQFQPVKFEQDVFLVLTTDVTAATFAAVRITAIVEGQVIGVK